MFDASNVADLLLLQQPGQRVEQEQSSGTLSRNIAPALETLQEVGSKPASTMRLRAATGTGAFQLVSKSGANDLHGSLYHYFQNDKLIANDFFFNRAGLDRPVLRRNEGAREIGSPIIKNKTFFFGSCGRGQDFFRGRGEQQRGCRMPEKSPTTARRRNQPVAAATWNPQRNGPINFAVIDPISRSLLKAKFSDGLF